MYPFISNGVKYQAKTFEELLAVVVYEYETLELIDINYYYAPNELNIIDHVIKYHQEVEAELETLTKPIVHNQVVTNLTHLQIRDTLHHKQERNKGIYYIPSLRAFMSTHLYNHYDKQKGNRVVGGCNFKRIRKYGDIKDVIVETLKLFDNSKIKFYYPYKINGVRGLSNTIEGVFELVTKHPNTLELVYDRQYYSKKAKQRIKTIRRGGDTVCTI